MIEGFYVGIHGIPDNPFADGGNNTNVLRIQKGVGTIAVAAYTATTDNFPIVHAEFDMYMDESSGGR